MVQIGLRGKEANMQLCDGCRLAEFHPICGIPAGRLHKTMNNSLRRFDEGSLLLFSQAKGHKKARPF